VAADPPALAVDLTVAAEAARVAVADTTDSGLVFELIRPDVPR
jgi:hypothetical protein